MMNLTLSAWRLALLAGAVPLLVSACVAYGGPATQYEVGVEAGPGYYEPYGFDYGGWGGDYRVAPYRDGMRGGQRGGADHGARAFRAAPSSRAMPSIPSGARSGARSGGRR